MHNLTGSVLIKPTLDPESRTAAANGKGVDRLGYERALALIHLGAHDRTTGNETVTFTVEESADNSSFAAISGATTGAIGNVVPDTDSGNVYMIDIDLSDPARLRYIRVASAVAGTTPIDLCSAVFLLSGGRTKAPTQDSTVVAV